MLNRENPVHTFETEAPLAIKEIGDVGLFKSGLLRQTQAGEIALLDALPKSVAKIVL